MGMPEVARRWTREEVLALPDDGNRYESVDGELLVTPAPRLPHQRAIRLLFQRLHSYVLAHAIGEILWSPADLDLRSEHLVQPDLFVFRSSPTGLASSWSDVGIPLLVVEIGSPTTARYDRRIKRPLYQRVGVPEYWIVDLEARIVERWRRGMNAPRCSPTHSPGRQWPTPTRAWWTWTSSSGRCGARLRPLDRSAARSERCGWLSRRRDGPVESCDRRSASRESSRRTRSASPRSSGRPT